jgi:serine/threonine protein kinase/tetratricopeptide (TPR) repeat protein
MTGETILHYKVIKKLGEGGMGVVYKAEDTKLKREVAIKFLPRQVLSNAEERQRFEIEAQAAAALNHPNIATIHAIEESDNEVFIVMEFINGTELGNKIKKESPVLEESLKIIEQIAEGLNAAHQKGIIHRDIKSSNIMITGNGEVKIMDFGLAKVGGTSMITKFGTTMGTTAYMSPEQARGDKVDNRTDIWSMGVLFYEMLTGKLPFKGDFDQAVIYSILNEEPESVISVKKDLPAQLDQLIWKMLKKDTDSRYKSANDFLTDLRVINNTKGQKSEDEKTIAVLPFDNIGSDKETDYFADGLAEELIINLSRIKEVRIVSRTNSMRYKGSEKDIRVIGRELGARYILEGSVRKFKDDLRISTQLVDVSKGLQLWGETYKGKLADVFDIQENVSKEIVEALRLKLSTSEKIVLEKRPTLNAEAFDLYLRARDFLYRLTKNNIQFAIQLFNKAIDSDKRYAAAYAGLSEAYAYLYAYFERSDDLLEKAIESGLRALMYDPSLSEAYAALAMAYYNKKLYDDALNAGQKAIELDPDNFTAFWILGRIYHSTDRDEEAIELFKKVILLNPDFYSAYKDLSSCYERIGNSDQYNKVLQKSMEVYPRYLSQHPDDARALVFFAADLAQLGKIDEARDAGRKAFELNPNDAVMLYNLACVFSRLGEKESGVDYLKNAIKAGYQNYEWIKRDSDFGNIRNEPGYIELMKGK